MGCCMSAEKSTVYEVVLDEHGRARRVPNGQGTHLIHVSKYTATRMEQKSQIILPSSISSLARPDPAYPKQPKMIAWNKVKPKPTAVAPVWDKEAKTESG